jgi:arsenate reductase
MNTVLFACIHNAGRSQMAAAWFNALADTAKAQAISAGTEPGTRVHPEVVESMREVGIEVGNNSPQKLTDELASRAAMLITMGCGEACPAIPGLRRQDWPRRRAPACHQLARSRALALTGAAADRRPPTPSRRRPRHGSVPDPGGDGSVCSPAVLSGRDTIDGVECSPATSEKPSRWTSLDTPCRI